MTAGILTVMQLTPWPKGLLWIPPMGYARAIILVLKYGGSHIQSGSELQYALIAMLVSGTGALIAGLYLHAVVPDSDGQGSSPFLCASRLCATSARKGVLGVIV